MTTITERSRTTGTVLVVLGASAWLIAWFVPAISPDAAAATESSLVRSTGARPVYGFHAFLWAATLVPEALERGQPIDAVLGATCATNFVMLAALLLHRFVAWRRGLGFALLACAVANTTWLFLCEPDMVAAYRAGYYLWLASFVLSGLGIVAARSAP